MATGVRTRLMRVPYPTGFTWNRHQLMTPKATANSAAVPSKEPGPAPIDEEMACTAEPVRRPMDRHPDQCATLDGSRSIIRRNHSRWVSAVLILTLIG